MINPARAIFTDRQRMVTLSVGNPTDTPISYGVSLITMRPDANGKLQEVKAGQETEEELLAKSLIRFSPRRATVESRKRQVVKLMVRKPKDLPFGEYQTRIRISPQESKNRQLEAQNSPDSTRPQFDIELLVGVSLPVIIQHGISDTEVAPAALALVRSKEAPSGIAANLSFSRKGSFSAFGDVLLTYTSSKGGAQKEIGKARGVALYQPKKEKSVTIRLQDITDEELGSGVIRVDFLVYQGQTKRKKPRQQIISKEFALR